VDSDAIPPWQYRHGVGQKRRNRRKIAPKAAPPIIGSVKSKIYHWQGCPNYRRLSAQHQVFFENKAAAEEAGFRAARNCP